MTGHSGRPPKTVTFSPESPVTFGRNRRSRSTGILGHDRPESSVTLPRNAHATISELETGKISDLSLTRAEQLANLLGYGLGVTGARRPKDEDALGVASRTAGVSFKQQIPPEALRDCLLRGHIAPDYTPQLRGLLDEAPIGVASAVAAQLERDNDVHAKGAWQRMRQLAISLGCTRPVWS